MENRAERGGAVTYVSRGYSTCDYGDSLPHIPCFIQYSDPGTIFVSFVNNTAREGGSILHINVLSADFSTSSRYFPLIPDQFLGNSIPEYDSDSSVYSGAMEIFLIAHHNFRIIRAKRGELITLHLAAIAFLENSGSRSRIYSYLPRPGNASVLSSNTQQVYDNCSDVSFRVYSSRC